MGLRELDWGQVRTHYDHRVELHRRLIALFDREQVKELCLLLLGITDPVANPSAAERGLGPKILASNGPRAMATVFGLARRLRTVTSPGDVPALVRAAQLRHLTLEVGSEASCLLDPTVCWVASTRSVWTHLLVKHGYDVECADDELATYRADPPSELHDARWTDIHGLLEASLTRIAEEGARLARLARVAPGPIMFLWADAIANQLYARNHG